MGDTLHVWNLRGHNADLTLLRPKLEEQFAKHQFGLIILDLRPWTLELRPADYNS
jgi:hypothetical protein